jgi:HSP20 family protein
MERLQRDMNRLFYDSFSQAGGRVGPTSYPVMNVWSNEEGAVITAELPGVDAEDIDISVVGDTLTLSGSRPADELEDGEKFHRRERSYGKFNRSFKLPFRIETDQIEASFDKGVLHISVPRSEADKPKKIDVKSA